MTPHGVHHRYYARQLAPGQLGTYAGSSSSSQFPRGHGMGQGEYCLGTAGNVIPCDTSGVMATLPALPGGGWVPSGQNIQTPPPTATTPALPSVLPALTSSLPWLVTAGAVVGLLLLSSGPRSAPAREGRRRRR